MKIIIGIILIYIILVVFSAAIIRYIMSPYKGTEHEETWSKLIKEFALGYFIFGLFLIMFFLILHFCF